MSSTASYWIIAAVLAILLWVIARIIKKHGKRTEWIGWLSIPLAAALLIMVLLGIRSCRSGRSAESLDHRSGQVTTKNCDRCFASWAGHHEGS